MRARTRHRGGSPRSPRKAAGNRAWGALARALATTQEEDSDVYFTVRDADTGGSVGEAYVNLERLLKGGVDYHMEVLQVLTDASCEIDGADGTCCRNDAEITAWRAVL